MKKSIRIILFTGLLLLANLFCKPGNAGKPGIADPVKPGAALVQVSNQFVFTEGPAVDKSGNIYFTDQPNDKIWKYDTKGKLSLFMDKTRRSNGMYFNGDGLLVACADEQNQLIGIDANKNITVLVNDLHGRMFNGPNDVWIKQNGDMYFTDPYYQRDYWTRKQPDLEKQNVYYLPAGKSTPVIADSLLEQPNGIVGTPDGKFLFVADIKACKTYKYSINADGNLGNRALFVSQGSDGMTLDNQGNLYLTGNGVTIFDPGGKKIKNIPVPSGWVGNICFGGSDRQTLFITASTTVYTLQMQVKGVE
jgi:gluconolactonase